MGLYKQPNDFTCGPFALKHALVALGKLANEDRIVKLAKPHWWAGTDELGLVRAAREYSCDLPRIRRTDALRAKRDLISYASKKIPVLLCVDDWGHWITCVRHESSRFVIIDSRDNPVLKVLSWKALAERWRYIDEDYDDGYKGDVPYLFDLHPVIPRSGAKAKAQFSIKRAQHLRRRENLKLSIHWDEYLGDLLEVCQPSSARLTAAMSMGEFLRRHQSMLLSRVTYWHGDIDREQVARVLAHFRFVAETYGLVIPKANERRAIADLAILLALWTAAVAGVAPMYGSDAKRKKRR